MGQKLMDALRTFKVDGQLVGRTTGPTVTQYEIEPSPGVKVRQFANLANDLALAMRARVDPHRRADSGAGARSASRCRTRTAEIVAFREHDREQGLPAARRARCRSRSAAISRGSVVIGDLAKMPHLLIAGATGSGKSVCVNTLITSLDLPAHAARRCAS